MREETFARQKKLGVIPADAQLTPRSRQNPADESLPQERQTIAARRMALG
jgi:arylsulfatase A-like enzyme